MKDVIINDFLNKFVERKNGKNYSLKTQRISLSGIRVDNNCVFKDNENFVLNTKPTNINGQPASTPFDASNYKTIVDLAEDEAAIVTKFYASFAALNRMEALNARITSDNNLLYYDNFNSERVIRAASEFSYLNDTVSFHTGFLDIQVNNFGTQGISNIADYLFIEFIIIKNLSEYASTDNHVR